MPFCHEPNYILWGSIPTSWSTIRSSLCKQKQHYSQKSKAHATVRISFPSRILFPYTKDVSICRGSTRRQMHHPGPTHKFNTISGHCIFVCFLTSSYGGNRGRSGLQCGRGNLPLDLCHSPDLALTHLAPQQILFTLRWTASNIQNFPPCANRRHKVAHSRSGHDGIKITIAFLHATINANPPQTNCNCLLVNKNPHKGQWYALTQHIL